MTRLIDADGLLPMMKYATTDSEIGVFPVKIGFNEIAKVIDDAPTVDAQPVRHGVWKKSEEKEWWWYCSNCQEHYFEDDLKINEKQFPNYCPNCGARMR